MALLVANWKMHGSAAFTREIAAVIHELAPKMAPSHRLVLCPPAPYLLPMTGVAAQHSAHLRVGAQDVSLQAGEGAHTGEISASMLRDCGCRYVIIGHSERRMQHGEDDAQIAQKMQRAWDVGILPILCIGESAEDHAAGRTRDILAAQIEGAFGPQPIMIEGEPAPYILAYEPVWAIGSGRTPDVASIAEISAWLQEQHPDAPILYGGSVNAENIAEILAVQSIAGALIGGVSVKCDAFRALLHQFTT